MKETVGLTFDNMCQDDDDTAIAATSDMRTMGLIVVLVNIL